LWPERRFMIVATIGVVLLAGFKVPFVQTADLMRSTIFWDITPTDVSQEHIASIFRIENIIYGRANWN
jgi:hypothetical protein